MMKKRTKTLKGMTLIEILISLAIFAMLSLVLVRVGTLVDRTNKATEQLNRRVTAESPAASAQDTAAFVYQYNPDGTVKLDASGNPMQKAVQNEGRSDIHVSIDDAAGNPINVNVKTKKAYKSTEYVDKNVTAEVDIQAEIYNTKTLVEDDSKLYDANGMNKEHNLRFADVKTYVTLSPITFTMSVSTDGVVVETENGFEITGVDTWVSSDTTVATVDSDGMVKPVGAGNCVIEGKKGSGVLYQCNVSVSN